VWGGGWGGPGWIGGGWGGARFGGVGAWYGGWNPGPARGWNRGPAWGWNRGPARGWAIPFASAAPISRPPVGRGHLGAPAIDAAVEVAIRTSNAPARGRAARLVALGDRHLRGAIDDPAKLAKAIDAYRRAANIAPDQPDTFLRQAIALTAAGKKSAAATAVGRAVAIDPRIVENTAAAGAHEPLIAPPAGLAPKPLVARSSKLLARIFAAPDSGRNAPADNWIAHRWLGRDAGPVMVASRP
jgi:tetratricopeptide (TPR) repeat protein